MRGRQGFTLVELMIVVSILGVLAAVAVPKFQTARAKAQAAAVIGSMRAIKIAATMYYDSAGTWPPTAAVGVTPPTLIGYLPRTATFTGKGYRLRWRRVTVTSGGRSSTSGSLVVTTTDAQLCPPIEVLLGGPGPDLAVNCAAATGRVTQTIDR